MKPDPIAAARRNALLARAQFDSSLGAVKYRLNPRTIASDAVGNVKATAENAAEKAVTTVIERPGATAAVAGLFGLVLMRRPIGRLTRRLFRSRRPAETPSPAMSDIDDPVDDFLPPPAAPHAASASAKQE